MNDNERILEGQLRECYGRVIHTHKTQERCADILLARHKCIKRWQIVLSALVTGGVLATLSDDVKFLATGFTAACSTLLLALNTYTKDYDLGSIAQRHRQSAADIWVVREKYLSLLTNLRAGLQPLDKIIKGRDSLLLELHAAYKGAPSTDSKAYKQAQKALKELGDMTFSDDEIDHLLPKELKRKQ